MPVIESNEAFEKRRGGDAVDANFAVTKSSVRYFKLRTDDVDDDDQIVLLEGESATPDPIPFLLAEHPNNDSMEVASRNVTPRDAQNDRLNWDIVVNYRKKVNPTVDPNEDGTVDPTTLPPQISFSFSGKTVVADRAYNVLDPPLDGKEDPTIAIQNSAGQPFDPPVTEEKGNRIINIVRNETNDFYDPNLTEDLHDTINNRRIRIADVVLKKHQGRIKISADDMFDEDGNKYWQVTYQIEVDRTGHFRLILDQGFMTFDSGANKLVAILDDSADPQPIADPVKLDAAGQRLAVGGAPKFLQFFTLFPDNWALLDLPPNKD